MMACALPTHAKLMPMKMPASGRRTDLAASVSEMGRRTAAPVPTVACTTSQRSTNLHQPARFPWAPRRNHGQNLGRLARSAADLAVLVAELGQGGSPLLC